MEVLLLIPGSLVYWRQQQHLPQVDFWSNVDVIIKGSTQQNKWKGKKLQKRQTTNSNKRQNPAGHGSRMHLQSISHHGFQLLRARLCRRLVHWPWRCKDTSKEPEMLSCQGKCPPPPRPPPHDDHNLCSHLWTTTSTWQIVIAIVSTVTTRPICVLNQQEVYYKCQTHNTSTLFDPLEKSWNTGSMSKCHLNILKHDALQCGTRLCHANLSSPANMGNKDLGIRDPSSSNGTFPGFTAKIRPTQNNMLYYILFYFNIFHMCCCWKKISRQPPAWFFSKKIPQSTFFTCQLNTIKPLKKERV